MVQRTTKSGSPLPSYLTQKPRQSPITPISKTQFQILQSGIRYAYSGSFGSGAAAAISVTLLDIGNSGDADLMCQLTYSLDYEAMGGSAYAGVSLSINGIEVFFTKGDNNDDNTSANIPTTYDFILPAHSALTVLGICEETTVNRICSIIGRPL